MGFVHALIEQCIEHPKLGGLIGLIGAIVFSVLGIASWLDYRSLPDQPVTLPLSGIAGRLEGQDKLWASAGERVTWDCERIEYRKVGNSENTEVILLSEDRTVVVLVTFTAHLGCDEVQASSPSGVFYRMTEARLEFLRQEGFVFARYPQATAFLDLCTVCSRTNSAWLIVLSAVLAALGIAIYPLCLLAKRERDRKRIQDESYSYDDMDDGDLSDTDDD